MAADAKRVAWWWLQARARAARHGRRLVKGRGIVWADAGRAELVDIEVAEAGRGEVTLRMLASTVSSGTERAQYLQLPNARTGFPFTPGYSASGVVIARGPGGSAPEVGQIVAVRGVPHSSVATVRADDVFVVPDGVDARAASTLALGIICSQGVRLAGFRGAERFCVVGAGPIGLLAQRLASAGGAGRGTVVARSGAHAEAARRGGADFVALESEELQRDFAVVIEAAGDPAALGVAIDAAAEDGRVVLLGSSRGLAAVPLHQVREKRLTLIGAHVETLAYERRRSGGDPVRSVGSSYLEALSTGAVDVGDLVETPVDPREADAFYRMLGKGSVGTAVFDWSRLPDAEAATRGSFLRTPDLRARGIDPDRNPIPVVLGDTGPSAPTVRPTAASALRVGLLGCGDIAVHNAAAVNEAPNASLVACFDPVHSLAEDLARTYGADVMPAAEALVERRDVDAIFLSVPHHLHAPLALLAIEAGKHVIVEKPLANNVAAAASIVSAAENAGVALSVCFPHRYDANVAAARELIGRGALGAFAGARLSLVSEKPEAYWYGGFSGRASTDWRRSREKAGGGFLIMNLSHYIDLILHLVRQEVESCAAATDPPGAEIEEAISLTMRFAEHGVATVSGTSAASGYRSAKTTFELWGEDGYLRIEPDVRLYTRRAFDSIQPSRWHAVTTGTAENSRTAYVRRLADSIQHDAPPEISGLEALDVQAVIEAAYASASDGATVSPADILEGVVA